MSRIFVPTTSAEDWRRLLTGPENHWRTGYSAKSLAYCWEEARGFPAEVKHLFLNSGFSHFQKVELLLAFPEYKVPLPGRGGASQNDLFVLGKAGDGQLMTIAVEGKVSEAFNRTVGEWLVEASGGKTKRLAYLRQQLGLVTEIPAQIRYQLLHRTASAVIEAKRFNARSAIMLVHSFSPEDLWFDEYAAFLELFGAQAELGKLVLLSEVQGINLYAGWAKGNPKYLAS